MDLKAVAVLLLCISCASSGGHERQKWMKWKEEKPTEDCDEPDSLVDRDDTSYFPHKIGSVPGIPGVDFPNYSEIPRTSFTCAEKDFVPGFYADLETDCQVFHVCYKNRRESFLCPIGTIFSQPILACDYWYSATCSPSKVYHKVAEVEETGELDPIIDELITVMVEKEISEQFSGGSQEEIESTTAYYKKPKVKYVPTTTLAEPVTEVPPKHKVDFDAKKDNLKTGLSSHKDPSKKSKEDLESYLKGDAQVIASMLLKSLLPIKSQVISLIAESQKSKKEEKVTPVPEATTKAADILVKVKPVLKMVKPKKVTPVVLRVPTVKMVQKTKPKMYVPVAVPTFKKPVQKMHQYGSAKHFAMKASPISLLTKKHLALNYAKLLKLKKLKSPLLGLKGLF